MRFNQIFHDLHPVRSEIWSAPFFLFFLPESDDVTREPADAKKMISTFAPTPSLFFDVAKRRDGLMSGVQKMSGRGQNQSWSN